MVIFIFPPQQKDHVEKEFLYCRKKLASKTRINVVEFDIPTALDSDDSYLAQVHTLLSRTCHDLMLLLFFTRQDINLKLIILPSEDHPTVLYKPAKDMPFS